MRNPFSYDRQTRSGCCYALVRFATQTKLYVTFLISVRAWQSIILLAASAETRILPISTMSEKRDNELKPTKTTRMIVLGWWLLHAGLGPHAYLISRVLYNTVAQMRWHLTGLKNHRNAAKIRARYLAGNWSKGEECRMLLMMRRRGLTCKM